MSKGKSTEGAQLVPFNSKVAPETKALVNALVSIGSPGMGSVREFIEEALKLFEQTRPEDMATAHKVAELLSETEDRRKYKVEAQNM